MLGCRARGLEPDVTLLPDGAGGTRVAHVALSGAAASPSPLYAAIGERHTNRGPYDGRPVPVEMLGALADLSGSPGLAVQWITDPGPRAAMGELLVDAAEALIADEQQSKDGFVWFRSSNDDVQRYRDGLVLDGQGVSPLVLGIAKLLPASSRTAGDQFWVDQTRTVHTATAAGVRRHYHGRAGRSRNATEGRAPAPAHPSRRDQPGHRPAAHEPDHRAHRPGTDDRGGAHVCSPVRRTAAAGRPPVADLPRRVSGASRPADPAPFRR